MGTANYFIHFLVAPRSYSHSCGTLCWPFDLCARGQHFHRNTTTTTTAKTAPCSYFNRVEDLNCRRLMCNSARRRALCVPEQITYASPCVPVAADRRWHERKKSRYKRNHFDFTINLTHSLPVQLLGASLLRIFIFRSTAIKFSSCEKEIVAFGGALAAHWMRQVQQSFCRPNDATSAAAANYS